MCFFWGGGGVPLFFPRPHAVGKPHLVLVAVQGAPPNGVADSRCEVARSRGRVLRVYVSGSRTVDGRSREGKECTSSYSTTPLHETTPSSFQGRFPAVEEVGTHRRTLAVLDTIVGEVL